MARIVEDCDKFGKPLWPFEIFKRILLHDSHFEVQQMFGRLDKKWVRLWVAIILGKTEMIETHLGEVDQRQSRLSQGIGETGGLPMIVLWFED